MPGPITLSHADPVVTAVIRERVPFRDLPRFVPAACGEVWNFVRDAKLPRPGRHVAFYEPGGWVEVGVEVAAPFEGNGRVRCSRIPGGPVATLAHLGPYPGLGAAHEGIQRWCAANGHRVAGTAWELYAHWDKAWETDPSRIRTDVFHLLDAPAAA